MFYIYGAVTLAGKVRRTCSVDSARMLCRKYLYSKHFLESDYKISGRNI
jgi:hypothetical protein